MGTPLDQATLIVALLVFGLKVVWRWVTGRKPYTPTEACGRDLLNGALVIPFGVMIVELFNVNLFRYMSETTSFSVALAGAFGLIFVWNEVSREARHGGDEE